MSRAVSSKYWIGCFRLLSEEKSGKLLVEANPWDNAGRETVFSDLLSESMELFNLFLGDFLYWGSPTKRSRAYHIPPATTGV
jgi:hypothetical protein